MTKLPILIGNTKTINSLDKVGNLGSHWTRATLGVGALCIEPFVDYYSNRKLDTKTRNYSVVKTCLKIIIGTVIGVTSRCIGMKEVSRYFIKLMANSKSKEVIKKALAKNSKNSEISTALFKNKELNNLLDKYSRETNKTRRKTIEKELQKIPVIKNMSSSFGDLFGVITTTVTALTLTIPLLNFGINKTMDKLFPDKNEITKDNSAKKKVIANA